MEGANEKTSLSRPIAADDLQIVGKAIAEFVGVIGAAVRRFESWWKEHGRAFSAALLAVLESLPPAYRAAMVELARHGWYVDMQRMGLGHPHRLVLALPKSETTMQAVEELALHFRTHLDEIEAEVCERFPHRAHILSQAFNAHSAGQYCLSIPVFFAQADGICFETIEAHFFMSDRGMGRPKTAVHVESDQHDIWTKIILAPLAEYGELNAGQKRRSTGLVGLNRHTVIHGETVDYGTELNSLKAVSLLNYVSQVLTMKHPSQRISEAPRP